MRKKQTSQEKLFTLCRLFIKESNTLKLLTSDLYEQFNYVLESMYYLSKHQKEIVELLLNELDLAEVELDKSHSFYHFMRYKKDNSNLK